VRDDDTFSTDGSFAAEKGSRVAYAFCMRYVLGFDGGGTKTECVLMDETRHVVAQSHGGPSNPMRVGFGGALASVCDAARKALATAHVSPDCIVSLCAGLAGTAHPDSARKMQHLMEEEFPGKTVRVCTDLDLTLAGTGEGPAIVLIAGTGSAAIGRDAKGRSARVGGHGYLLGDTGSAYHVGQQAVVGALRFFERTGTDSSLGKRILEQTGAADWPELQARINAAPDEVFPRLFPVVLQAAEEGDATARNLLDDCAVALAEQVKDLAERLQLQSQKFLLAKAGGMLGRSAYFDERLDYYLRKAVPLGVHGELQLSPAEAAARMALRLLPPE
jgi:N-acetylglucosamine kinase